MAKTAEEKAAKDAKKAAAAAPAATAADAAAAGQTGAEGQTAAPAVAQPAKAKATDPITVKYRDHKGETVERTFSKEVHGDKFAELAEEFKTTNASRLVKE